MAVMIRSDDGESIPISNRKETIWGICISFQILATIAVALRAYARLFVIKKMGWDDATIFLAWCTVFVGNTFICLCVNSGLGRHWHTLTPADLRSYLFRFYIAYSFYSISATLVKVSLLLQYLRFLKEGWLRYACIGLVTVCAMWGLAYSFLAFFPCFPVAAYWDWSIEGATCYAYGVKKKHPFIETFVSHAAINVLLDVLIVVMPTPLLLRRAMSKREKLSVCGLAAMGILVICLCIWRLALIVERGAGWSPTLDFTWRSPLSIILGCLEAQIAIVCVSIPIFYSVLEDRILQIFVQNEVEITEIAQPALELGDQSSTKSDTGSEAGLRPKRWSPPRTAEQKGMFYNQVIERVNPGSGGFESDIRPSADGGVHLTKIVSR